MILTQHVFSTHKPKKAHARARMNTHTDTHTHAHTHTHKHASTHSICWRVQNKRHRTVVRWKDQTLQLIACCMGSIMQSSGPPNKLPGSQVSALAQPSNTGHSDRTWPFYPRRVWKHSIWFSFWCNLCSERAKEFSRSDQRESARARKNRRVATQCNIPSLLPRSVWCASRLRVIMSLLAAHVCVRMHTSALCTCANMQVRGCCIRICVHMGLYCQ